MSLICGWAHGIDQIFHIKRKLMLLNQYNLSNLLTNIHVWSGIILLSSISILILTGIFFKFFSNFFETFYRIHWLMFITVLISCGLHGNLATLIVGGGFFIIDIILRGFFIMRYKKETLKVDIKRIENLDGV